MIPRILIVVAAGCFSAQGVAAQVTVQVGPVVYLVERLLEGGTPDRSNLGCKENGGCVYAETGTWFGAEGRIRYGALSLSGVGVFGSLENTDYDSRIDTGLRISQGSLLFHPGSWLAFGAEADVWRSIRTESGVTTERIVRRLGIGVEISGTLGIAGLRCLLTAAFFPVGSAQQGLGKLEYGNNNQTGFNARVRVALEYAGRKAPLYVRLGYREERFATRLPVADDVYVDQLRGVTVSAGLRFIR